MVTARTLGGKGYPSCSPVGVYRGVRARERVPEVNHLNREVRFVMVVLGLILLIIGLIASISILWIIGLILVIVGLVLNFVPVGGTRRRWY